ncbi:putative RNA-directed DNA polymerase from transposon X-element [Dictyocoela roeselum]|nr:putative RNA-directed DNA polymerase from transposon X-element [Dictyocoela roeselum]
MVPQLKKKDKKSPGNYRPISLTSFIGKLMEGLITDKITEFLESNELISEHGSRHNRSSQTNLLLFFKNIIEIHGTESPIDIIYLDFQEAFHKVPHKRLVIKLRSIGI